MGYLELERMQRILIILLSVLFSLSCRNNTDHEMFMSLLQKEMRFPKIVELDLFCNDLNYTKNLVLNDLESEGWINIEKKRKQGNIDSPLITFTDKAIPFLLPRSEIERTIGIQKIRIAEENLDEIINIQFDIESNSTVIEYTTVYRNITPFASLLNLKEKDKKTKSSRFVFLEGNLELITEK